MNYNFLSGALPYAGIALKAILLLKTYRLGLVRRYPVLAVYLGFSLFRSCGLAYLMAAPRRLFGLNGYSLFWVVTQPLLWLLYFLLFLELYSLVLEKFPGIRRLGRLVLFSGLAGITLTCAGLVVLDRQGGSFDYPFMAYLTLQERSVLLCLSLLMVLLALFTAHFRLSAPRNVWVLYGSFGSYFILSGAVLSLYHYFGDAFLPARNLLDGGFYLIALLGAVVLLSKAGEEESEPMPQLWGERNQEIEATLLLELQGFNQVLTRLMKQ